MGISNIILGFTFYEVGVSRGTVHHLHVRDEAALGSDDSVAGTAFELEELIRVGVEPDVSCCRSCRALIELWMNGIVLFQIELAEVFGLDSDGVRIRRFLIEKLLKGTVDGVTEGGASCVGGSFPVITGAEVVGLLRHDGLMVVGLSGLASIFNCVFACAFFLFLGFFFGFVSVFYGIHHKNFLFPLVMFLVIEVHCKWGECYVYDYDYDYSYVLYYAIHGYLVHFSVDYAHFSVDYVHDSQETSEYYQTLLEEHINDTKHLHHIVYESI